MNMDLIDISYFQKLDLRIGTINHAERIAGTKKLYKVQVDLGEIGIKQTVSGLVGYYELEDLIGKKVVFLTNLKPITLSGEQSEGMLLAAERKGTLALITVDRDIQNGAKLS